MMMMMMGTHAQIAVGKIPANLEKASGSLPPATMKSKVVGAYGVKESEQELIQL